MVSAGCWADHLPSPCSTPSQLTWAHCTVLTVLTALHCASLHRVYCIVLHCAALYCAVCAALYCAALCCTALCCTVLHSAALYSAHLCCARCDMLAAASRDAFNRHFGHRSRLLASRLDGVRQATSEAARLGGPVHPRHARCRPHHPYSSCPRPRHCPLYSGRQTRHILDRIRAPVIVPHAGRTQQ